MSLNMTLDGVDLFQTPTTLTRELLVDCTTPLSTAVILERYLSWARLSLGLPTHVPLDVIEWFASDLAPNRSTFLAIFAPKGKKYQESIQNFDTLAAYYTHVDACRQAIADGAAFSYI